METVWKIPETALRRCTKLCKIAGRKDPTSDLNLIKSASRLVQYLSNALPRWGLFSTVFEAKEELRELILSLVRTYCTLGPSKEKMKFIKRGYSLEYIYPLFWWSERELSFGGRIWRDDLYCVLFKNYHICNDSGGFKSLTKWGTRSFSPVDCSLAYKEGGSPGPPPVDRPWNDDNTIWMRFFSLDWRNADAKAIQIIKIYDSIRSENFDCQLKERLWGMRIFWWSGAHNPEWATSMSLCHDVFTNQFSFRTVLARILNIF